MAESPIYRFYRRLRYPLPFKIWEKLPRVPSYKNEYWDGKVQLTPRPRTIDIFLNLDDWSPPPLDDQTINRREVSIEKLQDTDWPMLPPLFHSAFAQHLPLSSWGRHAAARAARAVIEWSRLGRDGTVVRDACFVARGAMQRPSPPDELCGAAIVTLVPEPRLCVFPSGALIPDPEDRQRKVVPHLDWLFVARWSQRQGIGTLLLESVAAALRQRGVHWLASTCLLDNAPSLQWHWRSGFQLPPDLDRPGRVHVRKDSSV